MLTASKTKVMTLLDAILAQADSTDRYIALRYLYLNKVREEIPELLMSNLALREQIIDADIVVDIEALAYLDISIDPPSIFDKAHTSSAAAWPRLIQDSRGGAEQIARMPHIFQSSNPKEYETLMIHNYVTFLKRVLIDRVVPKPLESENTTDDGVGSILKYIFGIEDPEIIPHFLNELIKHNRLASVWRMMVYTDSKSPQMVDIYITDWLRAFANGDYEPWCLMEHIDPSMNFDDVPRLYRLVPANYFYLPYHISVDMFASSRIVRLGVVTRS